MQGNSWAGILKHNIYKRAGHEFYETVKSEPQDMVHRFWSGILLRRLERYEEANECFGEIPSGHELYNDSLKAIELTSRAQTSDHADESTMLPIRWDLSKEYNKLLDLTVNLATGQAQ